MIETYIFHFQVEFPEARIFEETLNVLLYENREKGPDQELMAATKGPHGPLAYHSDEEGDDRPDGCRGGGRRK